MTCSPNRPPALENQVVLITGSAGGLGRALVGAFAAAGATVIAGWNRHPVDLKHDKVRAVHWDVTQTAHCERVVAGVLDRHERLDTLINNAGVTADHSLWNMADPDWDKVLDVNLKGAFLCSRAVLPAMIRQQNGHIVNIASFSGRCGQRGQANYAAAKAGLLGLTTALARECGNCNVRVNAVLPGVLPTPMTAGLAPSILLAHAARNALQRLNDPEEVARFIRFIVTMSHVSGQLFQLDSRLAPWA